MEFMILQSPVPRLLEARSGNDIAHFKSAVPYGFARFFPIVDGITAISPAWRTMQYKVRRRRQFCIRLP